MNTIRRGFLAVAAIASALVLVLVSAAFVFLLNTPSLVHAAPQEAQAAPSSQETEHAATPCAGLPPGHHSLLERMTAAFELTCDQELKIEPLLHIEESVSKPLLRFEAFSPDEKQEMMLKIKIAARRQVRNLLTPDPAEENGCRHRGPFKWRQRVEGAGQGQGRLERRRGQEERLL